MPGRFLEGNHVTLLRGGGEYFPALIAAIDRARFAIFLETYIFASDVAGDAVAAALKAAARRGVRVHVLIDGYGSKSYSEDKFIVGLKNAGVLLAFYRPDVFRNIWRRTRLRRLHRKLVLIDSEIGFVGGINIIDDMHTPRHKPPRVDFAVEVRGPVLVQFGRALARVWNIVRLSNVVESANPTARISPVSNQKVGTTTAALVVRDNFRNRRGIETAYLEAINGATTNVTIANAYFLPGIAFRRALLAASARGVHVRLLLQARTEYVLLNGASKALYGQLLAGGIEIHEFTLSFLHAKVASIDDQWATIGSSNIDPLSLLLAREANLIVCDQVFAQRLRSEIDALIKTGAHAVTAAQWSTRPLLLRVGHWMTYGLARTLITFFAFGAKDYRA